VDIKPAGAKRSGKVGWQRQQGYITLRRSPHEGMAEAAKPIIMRCAGLSRNVSGAAR